MFQYIGLLNVPSSLDRWLNNRHHDWHVWGRRGVAGTDSFLRFGGRHTYRDRNEQLEFLVYGHCGHICLLA